MHKVRVVITDYIEPDLEWEEAQCRDMGVELVYYQLKTAPAEEIIRVVEEADIVIVNMARITQQVIGGLKRCKVIIRHGVGYDNVDIEAATAAGILVAYIPDYCIQEVAEQTLMLMLACQRKLSIQQRILRRSSIQNSWDFNEVSPIYRLSEKTVGIIGFGRIGSAVYRMIQGFGVDVLVTDPYLSEERQKELGIRPVPLEVLLKGSDVVTLHVPMTRETYHMVDEIQFDLMRPTAILINTSRGEVVNLIALDKALRERKLAFAGIDVYGIEPPHPDFPLLDNDKVILTPHLSWLSVESDQNIRVKIIENLRRLVNGQPPLHVINPEVSIKRDSFLSVKDQT